MKPIRTRFSSHRISSWSRGGDFVHTGQADPGPDQHSHVNDTLHDGSSPPPRPHCCVIAATTFRLAQRKWRGLTGLQSSPHPRGRHPRVVHRQFLGRCDLPTGTLTRLNSSTPTELRRSAVQSPTPGRRGGHQEAAGAHQRQRHSHVGTPEAKGAAHPPQRCDADRRSPIKTLRLSAGQTRPVGGHTRRPLHAATDRPIRLPKRLRCHVHTNQRAAAKS